MVLRQQADAVGKEKQLPCFRGSTSQHKQLVKSIKADGKGNVQAYVVLALRDDNDITAMTSKSIEDTVAPLMRQWAGDHLRNAHEHSGLIEEVKDEEDDDEYQYQPARQKSPRKFLYAAGPRPRIEIIDNAFTIEDEDSVVHTLWACLHFLQQNIVKRLSKALIKGICPRKQARYPYRNRKGESEGREVEIPPWWPSTELCRFKEPDHVERYERIELCIHFLRLRPTPEQLREWNSCEKTKQPVKTHQPHKWVAFLEELAPLSIVDETEPKDTERGGRRRNLMQKMYELAALEEEYMDGGIDGDTMVQPLESELQKNIDRSAPASAPAKRSRSSSIDATTADDEKPNLEKKASRKPSKKARTTLLTPDHVPVKRKTKAAAAAGNPKRKMKQEAFPRPETAEQDHVSGDSDCKPYVQGYEPLYRQPGWSTKMQTGLVYRDNQPSSYNTSFGSTMSDISSCDASNMIPPSPGASNMMQNNGNIAYQSDIQINQAYDVPHPQFDTMPNTPTFAPHDMLPFGQQHPNLGHEMAGLTIGMPSAPQHGPGQGQRSPAFEHRRHGLPSQNTMGSFRHWPQMPPQPFSYQVQPGVPSSQTQHAGFAVGHDPDPNWATPGAPNSKPRNDNEMPYGCLVFEPDNERPPATLPASVERGFTGHASGVGDSACPPGYPTYL